MENVKGYVTSAKKLLKNTILEFTELTNFQSLVINWNVTGDPLCTDCSLVVYKEHDCTEWSTTKQIEHFVDNMFSVETCTKCHLKPYLGEVPYDLFKEKEWSSSRHGSLLNQGATPFIFPVQQRKLLTWYEAQEICASINNSTLLRFFNVEQEARFHQLRSAKHLQTSHFIDLIWSNKVGANK